MQERTNVLTKNTIPNRELLLNRPMAVRGSMILVLNNLETKTRVRTDTLRIALKFRFKCQYLTVG